MYNAVSVKSVTFNKSMLICSTVMVDSPFYLVRKDVIISHLNMT
jgi:hypothetical protein